MNWLFYIGGWLFTSALIVNLIIVLFAGLVKTFELQARDNNLFWCLLLGWTLIWIWLCWKFI